MKPDSNKDNTQGQNQQGRPQNPQGGQNRPNQGQPGQKPFEQGRPGATGGKDFNNKGADINKKQGGNVGGGNWNQGDQKDRK